MTNKEQLIYAAILGAAIGDVLPTLGDYAYFKAQASLKEKLNKGEITPKQYWQRESLYYYTTNSLYWLAIGLILYNIKGDYHKKIKIGLWIIGGGAVIGVISKNIKKDEEFYKKYAIVKK